MLTPMAMGSRSHQPAALCIAPSPVLIRDGPASGFVGREIASPACVARGHPVGPVSSVTGGWSRRIATCLEGHPVAFRVPHRIWHRDSISSNRLRHVADTGLPDFVSTRVDRSQPSFTPTLQLAPSFYPRITGPLALAPIAGRGAGQAGGTSFGTRICPRTI